ncbi:MAG: hypothetical protein E7B42_08085, partial [Peptoniphilus harei]|nr:hypothetical protein [Peptoniphilus harei]
LFFMLDLLKGYGTKSIKLPSPLGVFLFFIEDEKTPDGIKWMSWLPSPSGVLFCSCTSPHCFRHTRATMLPSPCGVFLFFMLDLLKGYGTKSIKLPSPLGVFLFSFTKKEKLICYFYTEYRPLAGFY